MEVDTAGDAFFVAFPTARARSCGGGGAGGARRARAAGADGRAHRRGERRGDGLRRVRGASRGADRRRSARGSGRRERVDGGARPGATGSSTSGSTGSRTWRRPSGSTSSARASIPAEVACIARTCPCRRRRSSAASGSSPRSSSCSTRRTIRLVTLTGPGGHRQDAARSAGGGRGRGRLPGRGVLGSTRAARDPALVVARVAQALDDAASGRPSRARRPRASGSGRRLARPARQRGAPAARAGGDGVRLRRCRRADDPHVTSRERLQLAGERTYPVPELAARRCGRAVPRPRGGRRRAARAAPRSRTLPEARAAAAGARAGGGADGRLHPEQLLERLSPAARPAEGRAGRGSAAADAARHDRVELRAARRRGATALRRSACSPAAARTRRPSRLRTRIRTRCSPCSTRASLRRARRRRTVAALLDARDHPRVRR